MLHENNPVHIELKPSGTETRIFYETKVNAEDLVLYIARSSPIMVLTMKDKGIPVIQEAEFQLPVPSQCWEMIENANIFYDS